MTLVWHYCTPNFIVGTTVNSDDWVVLGCGDQQRAFKVHSLSQTASASILFAKLNEKQEIELQDDALRLLKTITKPVAVVTICGPYRTGKSYYLSRVLGDKQIFETSNELAPCTKGMMMATMVLECNDFVVVLLDTEGTDSIGLQGEVAVTNFIILSSLLSSVLVYNSLGPPKGSDVGSMR